MQKFGEGQVEQPDPHDPQGVVVSPQQEGLQHEGAAQDPEEARRALQQENDDADAEPGVYRQGDQSQG